MFDGENRAAVRTRECEFATPGHTHDAVFAVSNVFVGGQAAGAGVDTESVEREAFKSPAERPLPVVSSPCISAVCAI
jgi:hypothetical protein